MIQNESWVALTINLLGGRINEFNPNLYLLFNLRNSNDNAETQTILNVRNTNSLKSIRHHFPKFESYHIKYIYPIYHEQSLPRLPSLTTPSMSEIFSNTFSPSIYFMHLTFQSACFKLLEACLG